MTFRKLRHWVYPNKEHNSLALQHSMPFAMHDTCSNRENNACTSSFFILFLFLTLPTSPIRISQYSSSLQGRPTCVGAPLWNDCRDDTKLLGEPLACPILFSEELLYVVLIVHAIRHFAAKIVFFIHFTAQKGRMIVSNGTKQEVRHSCRAGFYGASAWWRVVTFG